MLACLFQTSSAYLAKTHASSDCPFLPHENVKSKPSFQEASFFGEVGRVPFLLTHRIISSQEERWKEIGAWKRNSLPKALHVDGKIFSFLSHSEILTGITSQDSKCFLSCYNPLKFFFSIPPAILSVFLTHSLPGLVPLLHPASLTQRQGKRPRRLSSLWPIIGECWEVFSRAAELISYLNTEDSRAKVCRWLNVTAYFNCKEKKKISFMNHWSVLWTKKKKKNPQNHPPAQTN